MFSRDLFSGVNFVRLKCARTERHADENKEMGGERGGAGGGAGGGAKGGGREVKRKAACSNQTGNKPKPEL